MKFIKFINFIKVIIMNVIKGVFFFLEINGGLGFLVGFSAFRYNEFYVWGRRYRVYGVLFFTE